MGRVICPELNHIDHAWGVRRRTVKSASGGEMKTNSKIADGSSRALELRKLRSGARPKAGLHPSRLKDLGRRGGRRKRRRVEEHGRENDDACSANGLEERCCNISSERWRSTATGTAVQGATGGCDQRLKLGQTSTAGLTMGVTKMGVAAGRGRNERQRWPGVRRKATHWGRKGTAQARNVKTASNTGTD